jgi:hypothetical protein
LSCAQNNDVFGIFCVLVSNFNITIAKNFVSKLHFVLT